MLEEITVVIAFGLIPVAVFAFLLYIYNLIRAPVFLRFEKEKEPRLEVKCITKLRYNSFYSCVLSIRNRGTDIASQL